MDMLWGDDDSEEGGEGCTDCCGSSDTECASKCPDCGHLCCEDCEVSTSRGLCWCEHSLRGDAKTDQSSQDGRNFLRSTFGYRGPFKPLPQARMEKSLTEGISANSDEPRARVSECAYPYCNAPEGGWTEKHPPNRIKLTDETLKQFVVCETCQSVAYCSKECREKDATEATRDRWDGLTHTHADICEPYMDNDSLPYVSVALRKYREKFGRYPHPLGSTAANKKKGDSA